MTDLCPECGTSLLNGDIAASEQYVNRYVMSNTESGEVYLSAQVCWKCGFSRLYADTEALQSSWFRRLAKTVWSKGGAWMSVPITYERSVSSIADETNIPEEFLIHHIDAFVEWINDPYKLFAHAYSQEHISRHDIETRYQGLVFRKEGKGKNTKVVLEDTRIINKM